MGRRGTPTLRRRWQQVHSARSTGCVPDEQVGLYYRCRVTRRCCQPSQICGSSIAADTTSVPD